MLDRGYATQSAGESVHDSGALDSEELVRGGGVHHVGKSSRSSWRNLHGTAMEWGWVQVRATGEAQGQG